jgi:excisionase family DNA binding protein
MKTSTEPWSDVHQLAVHFGQTEKWVRKYAYLIPHVRVGRQYRFRISEADAWLEQWRGGEDV